MVSQQLQDGKCNPVRPITVQPGHTENEVHELLASRQFVYADCYTVMPLVGDVMRYTTAQRRVSVIPVGESPILRSYEAGVVLITGLKAKSQVGVEVDEQEVSLSYPEGDNTFQGSLSWPAALKYGRLDGGKIRRDRFVAKVWDGDNTDWLGGFPMFTGLVAGLDKVGRQNASIKVKSNNVLMNVNMPKVLWQPNCRNTWGDSICGVNQADWAVIGTIGTSPTRSAIPWSGVDANYKQGKIHIDNGDSVVRVRTISRISGGVMYLALPLDFDPVAGQEFTAYPGCPRTDDPTYGCPKYHPTPQDWREFFKAFPYIPVAETAS